MQFFDPPAGALRRFKKYDLILDRLTASMTSRQEALATNLTPFFSDEANTQNLCSFYRSTSKKVPLEYRDSVMEMLRSSVFRLLLLRRPAPDCDRTPLPV